MSLCFCVSPRISLYRPQHITSYTSPFLRCASHAARANCCVEVMSNLSNSAEQGGDRSSMCGRDEVSNGNRNSRVQKNGDDATGKRMQDIEDGKVESMDNRDGSKDLWIFGLLRQYEIPSEVAISIVKRIGIVEIFGWKVEEVEQVLEMFKGLGLKSKLLTKVVGRRPDLLGKLDNVVDAETMLRDIGLQSKDIKAVLLRWPGIMSADIGRMKRVVDILRDDDIGFGAEELRALIRRASWILMYDIEQDVRPLIRTLWEWMGSQGIKKVIQGAPQVFGMDRQTINNTVDFLVCDIGLSEAQVAAVIQSCPSILTCSVESGMMPAVKYLRSLSISKGDLQKIVRAFPAILLLDVETEMMQVADFFRGRGIVNVGRIVTRLPPVLSYDLEVDIEPKMEYLEKNLGLTIFDFLGFPAYLSYSLENIILPRTAFLKAIGRNIIEIGLIRAIGFRQEEFCRRVAKVPDSRYASFAEALKARLGQTRYLRSSLNGGNGILEGSVVEQLSRASSKLVLRKRKRKKERRRRHMISRIPWKGIN